KAQKFDTNSQLKAREISMNLIRNKSYFLFLLKLGAVSQFVAGFTSNRCAIVGHSLGAQVQDAIHTTPPAFILHKSCRQHPSFVCNQAGLVAVSQSRRSASRNEVFALMAKKSDKEEEKNIFQKVGDGIKTAWQIFFISATVLSIALAADSIYKLTQQPITLETLGPALGNLLPVAALGYAGAARLVALAVRL
ncbi:unnamed protein product, partial [Heterosigma akashiwo]